MMATIVVPCGRLSSAITLACLEPARMMGWPDAWDLRLIPGNVFSGNRFGLKFGRELAGTTHRQARRRQLNRIALSFRPVRRIGGDFDGTGDGPRMRVWPRTPGSEAT
jgi:hypothetical protein